MNTTQAKAPISKTTKMIAGVVAGTLVVAGVTVGALFGANVIGGSSNASTTGTSTTAPTLIGNGQTMAIFPNSTQLAATDSCGAGNIALTFNDGPTVPYTQNIINQLQASGIKDATFFISPAANGVPSQAKCDLVKQLVDLGYQVESNSWSSKSFANMTTSEIQAELAQTSDFIMTCSGGRAKPSFFRPPMGELSEANAQYITSLGYVISFWGLDSEDWLTPRDYTKITTYISGYLPNRPMYTGVLVLMNSVDSATNLDGSDMKVNNMPMFFKSQFPSLNFVNMGTCYNTCKTALCKEKYLGNAVLATYS